MKNTKAEPNLAVCAKRQIYLDTEHFFRELLGWLPEQVIVDQKSISKLAAEFMKYLRKEKECLN